MFIHNSYKCNFHISPLFCKKKKANCHFELNLDMYSKSSTNGPVWYVKKTTIPSSRITKTCAAYPTSQKILSYVKQIHLLASPVKLILCGLSPFFKKKNSGDIQIQFLHRCYMFRRHLRQPQGALHQDLNLTTV